MQDGCTLSESDGCLMKCVKYTCICDGMISQKYKCPMWAEAIAVENYYQWKYNIDRVVAGV